MRGIQQGMKLAGSGAVGGAQVTRGQMSIFVMRGEFKALLPAGTPVLTSISPATLAPGTSGTFTITGSNTNFDGTTQVSIPGITVGTVLVNSSTSLTVPLTAGANATLGP